MLRQLGPEQAVDVLLREIEIPELQYLELLFYRLVRGAFGGVVDVALLLRLGQRVVPDEGDEPSDRYAVPERLQLEEPQDCQGIVADEEVAVYPFLGLHEDGPRLEPGLQDAEALLDPPESVVCLVDFPGAHPGLGGDEQVVACVSPGLGDLLLVEGHLDVGVLPVLLSLDGEELRAVSDLLSGQSLQGEGGSLVDLPRDLGLLLRRQRRRVCRDPLLLHGEGDLLPVVVREAVGERLRLLLVTVEDLSLGVPHVPPVLLRGVEDDPFLFGVGKSLPPEGFREDIAVFALLVEIIDVLCAVQALVGDLDDLAWDVVPALEVLDRPPQMRLLGFVPREHLHGDRDLVPVEHQRLRDDGFLPVLLGRPFPARSVLEVDLEVVVRAVEIGPGDVPPPVPPDVVVEAFDVLLIVASDVLHSVEDLVIGEGRASVEAGYDFLVCGQLRSGADGLRVDEGAEEVRHPVVRLPSRGHRVDVSVEPELVEHGLEEEMAGVFPGGFLSDLGDVPAFRVEPVDLLLRLGGGIADPLRLQVGDVSEGTVAAVPASFPGNVFGDVDLQI